MLAPRFEATTCLLFATFYWSFDQQTSPWGNNSRFDAILILEKLIIFWCLKLELGKIWNKLNRCGNILINQPNVLIFLRCARLRNIDNQATNLMMSFWESFKLSENTEKINNALYWIMHSNLIKFTGFIRKTRKISKLRII